MIHRTFIVNEFLIAIQMLAIASDMQNSAWRMDVFRLIVFSLRLLT